ncbi:MAG TPA: hypothetical protein EYH34_02530 [Planctomycetes bacterium]|nr:hypothetical protein [Planctomycetota bacterium]
MTTAWLESVVKQMSFRVKGTEMFWNDPHRAEAILQIRAAGFSDGDRLIRHLRQRPGSPFAKGPKPRKVPRETCKPWDAPGRADEYPQQKAIRLQQDPHSRLIEGG